MWGNAPWDQPPSGRPILIESTRDCGAYERRWREQRDEATRQQKRIGNQNNQLMYYTFEYLTSISCRGIHMERKTKLQENRTRAAAEVAFWRHFRVPANYSVLDPLPIGYSDQLHPLQWIRPKLQCLRFSISTPHETSTASVDIVISTRRMAQSPPQPPP